VDACAGQRPGCAAGGERVPSHKLQVRASCHGLQWPARRGGCTAWWQPALVFWFSRCGAGGRPSMLPHACQA
jgi:hypothetical protein